VVAEIAGESIRLSDVDREGEDEVWDAKSELYAARLKALNTLLQKKRLALEAKHRGVSVDVLLGSITSDPSISISKDQMDVLFYGLTDGYLADAEPEDVTKLTIILADAEKAISERRFKESLEKDHPATILLGKPKQVYKRYDIQGDGLIAFGKDTAPVKLHYFFDYSCVYCGSAELGLKQVIDSYGDQVQVIFRHAYEEVPEHERLADAAAICAKDSGQFWDFHATLYDLYENDFEREALEGAAREAGLEMNAWRDCYQRESMRLMEYAYHTGFQEQYKIQGTPTYFINGRRHVGKLDFSELKQILDEELSG
jgi:protein-disulfide isomerase